MGGAGAVVRGQLHRGGRREVRREPAEDADVRAAEAVDRLVRVADRGQPGAVAADRAEQVVLRGVDVLVLIHADVRPPGPQPGRDGRRPGQQRRGHLGEAVEVDQAQAHKLLPEGQPALRVTRELPAVPLRSGQRGRDPQPGGLVRDFEPLGQPGLGVVLAQDPQAQAVERGHGELASPARAQPGQAVPHLLGRPPGERDGQELPGRPPALEDLVGEAAGQRPGLAGPRPGDDQQRPGGRRRGPLLAIKPVEHRSGPGRRPVCGSPVCGGPGCGGPGCGGPGCGGHRGGSRCGTPARGQPVRGLRHHGPFGRILFFPGRGGLGGHGEQRRPVQFARLEQPDGAVLAVVARVRDHLAPAQPGDALAEPRTAGPGQVIERDLAQDAQLRPERGDQPAHLAGHLLALGPGGEELADDLGQLDQAGESRRPGRPETGRAVGQLRDAVQDPDRQRLAALRAPGGQRAGLLGADPDPALAVPVQVVLALFGEELDRAVQAPPGPQRVGHREVVQLRAEHGGLPAQHRRGVRVGVADQPVGIQRRAGPVHRRIRRQAGFHREDVTGQVGVAVPDRVEAGLGAEHGEPWRPDVRGDQEAAGTGRQGDLQQVPGIEAEDGPPVGGQVADLGQRLRDAVGGFEARRVQEMVHLTGPLIAAVDRGDLDREEETDRAGAGGRRIAQQPPLEVRADAEQAGLGRDQGVFQLRGPRGMGEVAGAEHAQALAQRPPGQMLDVAVLAARARELRVDMQVGVEHVGPILPRPAVSRAGCRSLPPGATRPGRLAGEPEQAAARSG